jgi:alpha-glucosidase (family GH31 glycosyl hydrolase)
MIPFTKRFPIHFKPMANPKAIVTEGDLRITVLTSRCLRVEWDAARTFEDRPSQTFWYREQPVPPFEVSRSGAGLVLATEFLRLEYVNDGKPLSAESLSIKLAGSKEPWKFGQTDDRNLMGTRTTLDCVEGACAVEPGLASRSGWAVVDDSGKLVFDGNGWLTLRNAAPDQKDLYIFGYGDNYQECIADYCRLAGNIPFIPRWSLGNWWSRYWEYSDKDLIALMERFKSERIPLSVCVIDMDWHVVKNPYSSGWTGYTWEKKLFPDPKGFMQTMHKRFGVKLALNLHPADGVYPHEDAYVAMARHMGINPESKTLVDFDIADPRFMEAYFRFLHHPQEKAGIDFWWLDWQQGARSKLHGLSPLYWLNHLHNYDLARSGKRRPFVFSRWPGMGGHRYQIGFSGDTVVCWESLAFQPYFTATASNVAFTWWSHDIGGHFWGVEDPELYARWLQLGTFSPIFRIHSSKSSFQVRHPWDHGTAALDASRKALQLRHALIPYLYSMAYRTATESLPLVRPMYWAHPKQEEAYWCPGQYLFGTELLVAPFVKPIDPDTRHSRQVVWFPEGDWYNFFTGVWHKGGRHEAIYGRLEDLPVFARAGAIVPLAAPECLDGVGNPNHVDLRIFAGADNAFVLHEDDGESRAWESGVFAQTCISLKQTDSVATVAIATPRGDLTVLPAKRAWTVSMTGIVGDVAVRAEAGGKTLHCKTDYDAQAHRLTLSIGPQPVAAAIKIRLKAKSGAISIKDNQFARRVHSLLFFFKAHSNVKEGIYTRFIEKGEDLNKLEQEMSSLTGTQRRCLCEVLFKAGFEEVRDYGQTVKGMYLWNAKTDPRIRFMGKVSAMRFPFDKPVPPFESIPTEGTSHWGGAVCLGTDLAWSVRLRYADAWAYEITRHIPGTRG